MSMPAPTVRLEARILHHHVSAVAKPPTPRQHFRRLRGPVILILVLGGFPIDCLNVPVAGGGDRQTKDAEELQHNKCQFD